MIVPSSLSLFARPAIRIEVGDRVRMNERGRQRHPRYGLREGVVVGRGSPSSVRIKFDERKSVQTIHEGYLERLNPPESDRSQ